MSNDLTWNYHISQLDRKIASQTFFSSNLSDVPDQDLLTYYKAIIKSVAEYACQAWNPGLTKGQNDNLEKLQERAL